MTKFCRHLHYQIMLCIQEDLPDVKYMSGKNRYSQFLAVTTQLPLYEFPASRRPLTKCGLNLKKSRQDDQRSCHLLEMKKLMWDITSV